MKFTGSALVGLLLAAASGRAAAKQAHLRHGRVDLASPVGGPAADGDDDDTKDAPTGFDDLEQQVMSMAGHGQQSVADRGMDDVSKMIDESLLPSIMNESEHAQQELDSLIAAYTACDAPSFEAGALKTLSDAREPKRQAEEECRGKENTAYEDSVACEGLLTSLKGAMDATCGAVEALKRDPADAAKQCKPAASMEYGHWLEVNERWFKEQLKEFSGLKKKCDNATSAYDAQVPICSGKKTAVSNQREECNVAQAALEESYCDVKEAVVDSCHEYGTCYSQAEEEYNRRVPVIKAEEKSRKVNYRVLKRIGCLLPILQAGGKAEDIEACKKKVWDTKPLDLNYTEAPAMGVCPETGPMPGDDDFAKTVYASLPLHAVAAEVKPCPGAAPPVFSAFKLGAVSGSEICAADTVFEYTKNWLCKGRNIRSVTVPAIGSEGWEAGLSRCAEECKNRPQCASFAYSQGRGRRCWLKHTSRKSESRGWNCGKANGGWGFFTRIPGATCKSPPAGPSWQLPVGIQNNWALSQLPSSWKVFTDTDYAHPTKIADTMPTSGDCMLMGAKASVDADAFAVVAFANRTLVALATGGIGLINGAYWYRIQGRSFGLSDEGSVSLNDCDTLAVKSMKRMCWQPSGGWRAGSYTGLNEDHTWRKVVMYGPCH